MENDNQWFEQAIQDLIKDEPSFIKRALLDQTNQLFNEQTKRIEQAKGEIDGRLWDKNNW